MKEFLNNRGAEKKWEYRIFPRVFGYPDVEKNLGVQILERQRWPVQ